MSHVKTQLDPIASNYDSVTSGTLKHYNNTLQLVELCVLPQHHDHHGCHRT